MWSKNGISKSNRFRNNTELHRRQPQHQQQLYGRREKTKNGVVQIRHILFVLFAIYVWSSLGADCMWIHAKRHFSRIHFTIFFLTQLNEHNINTFKTHWHHICVYICEYTRCACSVIELVSNEKQIFRDIANRQTLREKNPSKYTWYLWITDERAARLGSRERERDGIKHIEI